MEPFTTMLSFKHAGSESRRAWRRDDAIEEPALEDEVAELGAAEYGGSMNASCEYEGSGVSRTDELDVGDGVNMSRAMYSSGCPMLETWHGRPSPV